MEAASRTHLSTFRLADVPVDQHYCMYCDRQIVDEDDVGDLWWQELRGAGGYAVVLCGDCA